VRLYLHPAHLPRPDAPRGQLGALPRYRPEAAPVLHGVSLDVHPGEVIGIVGRSGSGKSTLTKLVQRLYVPEGGRLLVDGIDISLIDAAQLRRQVGVVLQENLLFNRSVRENIAITDPAAPIEAVVRVAQLAGAHDFISELPEGYDTVVGEQGSSLSGGQRQRIAIARALFTNPRILIFDEATSALDYESEAVIQRNMAHICQGRTVLNIAHRLSAVRRAHRIIVMDKGRIVEAGPHDALVAQPKGLYAYLWRMQDGAGAAEEAQGAKNMRCMFSNRPLASDEAGEAGEHSALRSLFQGLRGPLVQAHARTLGRPAHLGVHLGWQAQHHAARKRLLGRLPALLGQRKVVVYCAAKRAPKACHAIAVKPHDGPNACNAADEAAVFFAVFHFGRVALVGHGIAHGLTPINSRNSRAQRTWYGLTSLAGWGRWKSARSPFKKKLTIEPPRFTHCAPSATSSDSMSNHSRLLGTGFSKMRASVFRCLLFMRGIVPKRTSELV